MLIRFGNGSTLFTGLLKHLETCHLLRYSDYLCCYVVAVWTRTSGTVYDLVPSAVPDTRIAEFNRLGKDTTSHLMLIKHRTSVGSVV